MVVFCLFPVLALGIVSILVFRFNMTEIYEELEEVIEVKRGISFPINKVIFSREFSNRQTLNSFKNTRTNTRIKRIHIHNHNIDSRGTNLPCRLIDIP